MSAERGTRVFTKLAVRGRELAVQASGHPDERRVWLVLNDVVFGVGGAKELGSIDLNEEQARAVRDALDAFLESTR